MSTFGGKIKNIPNISIDRFDGENLYSKAYFLSHCHWDHMKGLDAFKFQNKIIKNIEFLYASSVSCAILRKMFPVIKNQLKELCLHSATSIFIRSQCISVHPIPAGHCPGSVMFLIECGNQRVLYTGDYRINSSDIEKFKPFYDSFGCVKPIDTLYLDTTFFLQSHLKFPTRQESLEELCRIIGEWISQNDNSIIHLVTSAKYGYEYIFSEIFKLLRMSVHISNDSYKFYSLIPELDHAVTKDGSVTKIHCSCGPNYTEICRRSGDWNIKKIKVSAFRWNEENLVKGLSSVSGDEGMHYVCYSTHASYEEGVKLIEFLRPKEILACVEHQDIARNKTMLKLIDDKLNEIKNKDNKEQNKEIKLFEIKAQIENESNDSSILLSSQGSSNTDCDIFDSPPKKFPKFYDEDLFDSPPR